LDVSLGLTRENDVGFPLSWGVIGAGEISRQFVGSSRQCEGATMVAVFSRSATKAAEFASVNDVENWHDNLEAMLARDDLDIVYVGTPDELHKEHCLLAINAGKHVLCEKILAKTPDEAKEMFAAAKRMNVMLQDGVWTRFFPAVEHARNLIESGVIGDVVMVQADFDRFYTAQAATLAYGSEVKPVSIKVSGRIGGPGGAIIEFDNNRFAVLTFVAFPSEFPEVTEITGTKGRITLEQPAHCPTKLTLRVPIATPSRYMNGNTPSPLHTFEYPLPDSIGLPGAFPNQQGFLYMTQAVHRCLGSDLLECPQFTRTESLHLLELFDSIRTLSSDN